MLHVFRQQVCCPHTFSIELTARLTSEAFYNGEVESEVRLLVREGKLALGDCIFRQDCDRETIMDKIEHIRSHSIYPHHTCAKQCEERGDTIRIIIMTLHVTNY